jgi:hypothetical protein
MPTIAIKSTTGKRMRRPAWLLGAAAAAASVAPPAATRPMVLPVGAVHGPHDDGAAGAAAAPLAHPPNAELLLGAAEVEGDWRRQLLVETDARLQEQVRDGV